jgi:hypothetical protein
MWRGAVASAIRGKCGQAFLKEMLTALDALPKKKLIREELQDEEGAVCALGAVGRARGLDMSGIALREDEDGANVARAFGIPKALAREIMWMNDDAEPYWQEATPEQRFVRVRKWIVENIKSADGAIEKSKSNAVTSS